MFSDPKYSFSVCQKKIFFIQSKVNIFHQIQPKYATYTELECPWYPDNQGRVQSRWGVHTDQAADTGNEVIITSTPEADPD